MSETKQKKGFNARTALIIAAVVLACFVVVMAIVLIVPKNSASQTKIESVAAYNEEHGTDFLYPVPPAQTAELYTDMETFVYRSGWSDQMLRVNFRYVDNLCTLYIQMDADADLASQEAYSFLKEYNGLNRTQNYAMQNSDGVFSIRYKEQGGTYFAKFEADGAVYYLNVDTEGQDHARYFSTIAYAIVEPLVTAD